ncbi:hypothetical protein [Komagataeibacter medellinensis]|uniref:hypothetical protein n=1 Tax=Komagataeibacter medellinensis TaxID=1177712 RepID=UPI00059BC1BE|nr:hypothetical protein [Komagataeibacter medellinensis]
MVVAMLFATVLFVVFVTVFVATLFTVLATLAVVLAMVVTMLSMVFAVIVFSVGDNRQGQTKGSSKQKCFFHVNHFLLIN